MVVSDLFKKTEVKRGLFAFEKAALFYNVFTLVLILLFFGRMDHPSLMIVQRLAIAAGVFALMLLYKCWPCRIFELVRCGYQLGLLAYWYSDTFEFNRMFPNLDHLFASAEQWLFGCQPALLFAQKFPQFVVSELLNLGYVSYFPMIASVALWYFFCRPDLFHKTSYVLASSFFVYYLIFIFLPVAGPQFYFPAIGEANVIQGIFPSIGDYFNLHHELLPNNNEVGGFFYSLVESSQTVGERPTAAFPSSHVGISTILMFMAWRGSKRFFGWLFPFYVLLCMATVYIQAHYLIDVIAGFISAFIVYAFTSWIYRRFLR